MMSAGVLRMICVAHVGLAAAVQAAKSKLTVGLLVRTPTADKFSFKSQFHVIFYIQLLFY